MTMEKDITASYLPILGYGNMIYGPVVYYNIISCVQLAIMVSSCAISIT